LNQHFFIYFCSVEDLGEQGERVTSDPSEHLRQLVDYDTAIKYLYKIKRHKILPLADEFQNIIFAG